MPVARNSFTIAFMLQDRTCASRSVHFRRRRRMPVKAGARAGGDNKIMHRAVRGVKRFPPVFGVPPLGGGRPVPREVTVLSVQYPVPSGP